VSGFFFFKAYPDVSTQMECLMLCFQTAQISNAYVPSITEVDLPECWASAIINGDYSGLTVDEVCAIEAWFEANPQIGGSLCCSDSAFIGRFEGLQCSLLTYSFSLKPSY